MRPSRPMQNKPAAKKLTQLTMKSSRQIYSNSWLKTILAFFVVSLLASSALGQVSITGQVSVKNIPDTSIPFANIAIQNSTIGTAADMEGNYVLTDVSPGNYILVAAAIGFQSQEIAIEITDQSSLEVNFLLDEAVIEMDGIMVTGNLVETFIKDSPVKVNVISSHYLEKIPSANIMEVLENVNGLYQQIDCAVCGTNNIRINGMDGPYSAVLIDGMPIMSSLATVYGLNGISPSLLQQVEVIKGPMSTLYGSEAMGGVINIITKTPQTAPTLAINTFGTNDGEYAMDVGVVPTRGKFATLLSGTVFYNNRFVDENGDDFADLTLNERISIFGKGLLTDKAGFKQFSISSRYYFEDRMGGTQAFIEDFSNALRGSDQVYGESIRTERVELVSSYYFNSRNRARLDFSFNHHDQDSFYGDESYQAKQTVGFAQFVLPIQLDQKHSLMLGSALRIQSYDDNTGATGLYDEQEELLQNRPDNRTIPGLFGQHEFIRSSKFRLLSGFRLDYQKDHGLIPSPRLSLKFNPSSETTIRLNGGTGFRIVNLFTEDHAAYSGARATILLEDLKPERSLNSTFSIQQIIPAGVNPITIDLDGFYTYFTNKIEPDYETPGVIQYANLDGSATTRGLSATINQNIASAGLSYTIGGTLLDVFTMEDGVKGELEFAPAFQGTVNLTYRIEPLQLLFDYTMNLTGPMKLPEFEAPFERPGHSPTFSVHNVQITKDFTTKGGDLLQAYFAIENLFSYTQTAPLIDPANPFGPNFDTSYVYGPLHGRHLGFGIRLTML